MFENIEKAHTVRFLAIGLKLDWEDEQCKKRKKKVCLDESMVKKPSTYKCIPKYISGITLER